MKGKLESGILSRVKISSHRPPHISCHRGKREAGKGGQQIEAIPENIPAGLRT